MFGWSRSEIVSPQSAASPATVALPIPPVGPDTNQTRRAAQLDLFRDIGEATETNLSLHAILRDAFSIVDEIAAFSSDFEDSAEATRVRTDQS